MTALDPKTVREIARQHIRSGRTDIGTTIVKHFGSGVLGDEDLWAWEYAVHEAWQTELRAVSWPDEQQPAEATGGEQAQDGAAAAVRRTYEYRVEHGYKTADYDDDDIVALLDNREAWRNLARSRTNLAAQVVGLEAERDALAARVAELEGEREADARAVAAFQAASGQGIGEIAAAGWAMVERFADRIAPLDADADGGAK
jgi:hypothetical protein